jgi:hypothetical protein
LHSRGMAFVHEHGSGWLGSRKEMIAPSCGSLKGAFVGERQGVSPRFAPLGAVMRSSGFLRQTLRSTAITGGTAFANHHGIGLPRGSTTAVMAPSGGPLKTACLQGKKFTGSGGPCPLGAAMDSSAYFCRRDKYCHNGGMAFAHYHGVGLPGVHDGRALSYRRLPAFSPAQGADCGVDQYETEATNVSVSPKLRAQRASGFGATAVFEPP